MARYRPRSLTATGDTTTPTSAAVMPAPGSQIQMGSEWPQVASPLVPPR